MIRVLCGAFALLITVDALSHVFMGHEWTLFVFQTFILKYATAWPFMTANEYIARANASEWYPVELRGAEQENVFPFTPILWDTFVVFRQMPGTVLAHCLCGAVALPVGFLQMAFLSSVPRGLHRALGWLYATSFTVVAITGSAMGAADSAGMVAKYNFAAMSIFALLPTWMAIYCAVCGRLIEHREWMVRSYSVCFSVGVLLRLSFIWLIPVMVDPQRLPEDVHDPYMVLVFLSWSLPLLLSDIYLTAQPLRTLPGSGTGDKRAKGE